MARRRKTFSDPGNPAEMKQPTKRTLQAIETKARICQAATRLMERKSFDAITIEQIRKEAGVSIGAFYHHYLSKNDILTEIYRWGDDFFRDQVVDQLSDKPADEAILGYFDFFVQFYVQLGVAHIKSLYKSQSKMFINKERYMIVVLREIVTRGVARGELTPAMGVEKIVDFLLAAARGLAFTWCLHDGNYPFAETLRDHMQILVKALSPRADRCAR